MRKSMLKIVTRAIATPGSAQTLQSTVATPNNVAGISTPGPSVSLLINDASSLMQAFSSGTPLMEKTNMDPVERLVTTIDSMSAKALSSAVEEMNAVISCNDKLGASAPGNGSRAAVGEGLASITKAKLQSRIWMNQDSNGSPQKKLRRYRLDYVPPCLDSADGSVVNSLHRAEGSEPLVTGSMITSNRRSPRLKVPRAIREEIRQANQSLIDTEVEVSEEGTEEATAQGREGLVVTCCYKAAAVSPTLTRSTLASPSRAWLIIPPSYPQSSPVFWSEHMTPKCSPVSSAAQDAFVKEVRSLSAPITLKAMAACWDRCARNALAQIASHHGGGTLSTSIGVWE